MSAHIRIECDRCHWSEAVPGCESPADVREHLRIRKGWAFDGRRDLCGKCHVVPTHPEEPR